MVDIKYIVVASILGIALQEVQNFLGNSCRIG